MGKVLGIAYRTIATHLVHKAGFQLKNAHTGAVTRTQRFGSAIFPVLGLIRDTVPSSSLATWMYVRSKAMPLGRFPTA